MNLNVSIIPKNIKTCLYESFCLSFTYLVFLFISSILLAQNEFLEDHSGISGNYLISLERDYTLNQGGGLDVFFNNGLALGLGYGNKLQIPIFSVGYFIEGMEGYGSSIFEISSSITKKDEIFLLGFHLSPSIVFLKQSFLPFSLSGSFSVHSAFSKNDFELFPNLAIAYTQAIRAFKRVYPYLGIACTMELKFSNSMNFFFCGFIFEFSSPPE